MEQAKSLLQSMKEQINNAGANRGQIFYVKKDNKVRVRFLNDFNEAITVNFHEKWKEFMHPCLNYYGKECPNCNNDEAKNTTYYIWTIWNYEAKERQLFMYKANRCSPIPALISMFEEFDTICDRDFAITKAGEGTSVTFTMVPLDKKRFKGDELPFGKKEVMTKLLKAFPCKSNDDNDDEVEDDENKEPLKSGKHKPEDIEKDIDEDDEEIEEDEDNEDEEKPKRNKKNIKSNKNNDDDDLNSDDEENNDDDDEETPDFDSMSNAELKEAAKKYKIKNYKSKQDLINKLNDAVLPF